MFEDYYKSLGEARSACRNRTVYKETDAMEQNRQAAQNNPEPEFAAFVAIDWADQKHYWSLREAGSKRIERGEVENTPEAMEVWAAQWSARFEGRPIAVALEQRRGAVVAMLSKYEQLHLYPVHPLTLANYRQAFYPSRNKNDVLDADLLLELLCEHRDRLRRLDPDTAEMRLLQFQVENRRKLVDERTAVSNRLTDLLKMYFPQIVRWFEDVSSALVGDLLLQWPTLAELHKAKTKTLERFFQQHHGGDREKTRQRMELIRTAIPATHDEALLVSSRGLARVCVRQLAVLREAIPALEKEIEQLAHRQADWEIFDSLPGAGKALAPRLMAAMGSRRERYESASQVQCFAGIAPVKEASGNMQWVHMRWACPKFLRQTFHEWAACSIPQCGWAKAYYDELRGHGKKHHTAVRALAFKWMRILYRCWKDRKPYREEVYLASLAKRRVPMKRLVKSVQMP
jgi:transposase